MKTPEKKRITIYELEAKPLRERIKFMAEAYMEGHRAYKSGEAKEEMVEQNKKPL